MPKSTVTSKGQTTIPHQVRSHLGLKTGDRVEFVIDSEGRVVLEPATVDAAELEGILAPAPRRVSLEEMDAAIRKRAARR